MVVFGKKVTFFTKLVFLPFYPGYWR
jgi:hypothetical protein